MKRFFTPLLLLSVIGFVTSCSKSSSTKSKVAVVTVFAGSGATGDADGTGTAATFYGPFGLVLNASGTMYISDENNALIRQISAAAAVTTLAGNTYGDKDGTGSGANFFGPCGLAIDGVGNVYVADATNQKIRMVTPSGVVTTLAGSSSGYADGTGANAQFDGPTGLAVDGAGNVYVADSYNHRIRKITPAGVVTTIAGSGPTGPGNGGYADGPATTTAQFHGPEGLAIDASGNIYVADFGNFMIRKISTAGVVSTIAGSVDGEADGTGAAAEFGGPTGIALDAGGNAYVTDYLGTLRKVTPAGVVTTLVGGSGTATAGALSTPAGIALDASGNIFIADYSLDQIIKVSFQ